MTTNLNNIDLDRFNEWLEAEHDLDELPPISDTNE
jgi:hypothetical protein